MERGKIAQGVNTGSGDSYTNKQLLPPFPKKNTKTAMTLAV